MKIVILFFSYFMLFVSSSKCTPSELDLMLTDSSGRPPPARIVSLSKSINSCYDKAACGKRSSDYLCNCLKCCCDNSQDIVDERPQFVRQGDSYIWAPNGTKTNDGCNIPYCCIFWPCTAVLLVGSLLCGGWMACNNCRYHSLSDQLSQQVLHNVSQIDTSVEIKSLREIFLGSDGKVNYLEVKKWVDNHGGWNNGQISTQPSVNTPLIQEAT